MHMRSTMKWLVGSSWTEFSLVALYVFGYLAFELWVLGHLR